MIPAQFDYVAPESLDDALAALRDGGEDAKIIAGGHSLLPLMKLRLAAPSLLVDLRRVPGLSGIQRENGSVRIGAMTHHHDVATGGLGLASTAASTIADQQVRNRGTIGGSLAHGDPAADMPAVLLASEGTVTVRGQSGQREVAAADLFHDFLTTAIGDDEILKEVRIPKRAGWGAHYEKFVRVAHQWPIVAVAAAVKVEGGTISEARVGLTNMGSTPLRARTVEDALVGQPATDEAVRAAAASAADGTNPPSDLNGDADYRRHLATVLTRRAVLAAAGA